MIARPVAQVLVQFGSAEHQEGAGPVGRDTACPELPYNSPVEDFSLAIQLAREEGVAEVSPRLALNTKRNLRKKD